QIRWARADGVAVERDTSTLHFDPTLRTYTWFPRFVPPLQRHPPTGHFDPTLSTLLWFACCVRRSELQPLTGDSVSAINPHRRHPRFSNQVRALTTHGGPMPRNASGSGLAKPSNDGADESGSSAAFCACFLRF